MNNWDDLKLMLELSNHGTMTATAKALGVNTATVSRRLERLTEEFGSTLFVRRGLEWQPTQVALPLIQLAELMSQSIQPVQAAAGEGSQEHKILRVHVWWQVLVDVVGHQVGRFLKQNKKVVLDLVVEDLSVALGEVDLKVSFEEPVSGRLVRQQVGEIGYNIFVHKDWHGKVEGYIGLSGVGSDVMPCIAELQSDFLRPRLVTQCTSYAIDVLHTMPLAMCLPTRLARRYPDLVLYHSHCETQFVPVWASFHESRRLDPDVRLALGFIKGCFEIEPA